MSYAVTGACLGCKDRSCVSACPVDCFFDLADPFLDRTGSLVAVLAREPGVSREEAEAARPSEPRDDPGMLMIDPDECIGCGACETECPVAAIHEIEALSPEDEGWAWANRFLTQALSPAARDAQRCRR